MGVRYKYALEKTVVEISIGKTDGRGVMVNASWRVC